MSSVVGVYIVLLFGGGNGARESTISVVVSDGYRANRQPNECI